MTKILYLNPEDAERLHPAVLKWFDEQGAAIEHQLKVDRLSFHDVQALLSDDDREELARRKNEIGRWLGGCTTTTGVPSSDPIAAGIIGYYFMLLQLNSFPHIQSIRSLLKKVRARKTSQEFNHLLDQQIRQLRSHLEREVRDLSTLFRERVSDQRFTGHSFEYILSTEAKASLDATLVRVMKNRLGRLIPQDLRHCISVPSRYSRLYIALPTTSYTFDGVPCLSFSFDIFAAACTEVWLKPSRKTFDGLEFSFPSIRKKNGLSPLESPKLLGLYYSILEPKNLGIRVPWKSIPLVIVTGLLQGEILPEGTTVSAASLGVTTYKVQGFGKEVDVPDQLADYLRSIGSIDEMIAAGIMAEKVGKIVKAALTSVEARHGAPPVAVHTAKRGSMKEKAFRLFDQGRRPSDPEVRTLGIKPNSAYRYFQAWKKERNHTSS